MPMQKGDVPETLAIHLYCINLGYHPETDYRDGINLFVKWYRNYYNK